MKSHGKSKAVIAAVIFEVNSLQSSRFGETLRRQYQRELSAREHYEALAPMSGARACTMRELALDECRHAQSIYELLQGCL